MIPFSAHERHLKKIISITAVMTRHMKMHLHNNALSINLFCIKFCLSCYDLELIVGTVVIAAYGNEMYFLL